MGGGGFDWCDPVQGILAAVSVTFGFYRSGAEGPLLSEARLLYGISQSTV